MSDEAALGEFVFKGVGYLVLFVVTFLILKDTIAKGVRDGILLAEDLKLKRSEKAQREADRMALKAEEQRREAEHKQDLEVRLAR